jgi:EAL domain-containing protein (putative c-di-GMP-specific phosphodiesterase class I)
MGLIGSLGEFVLRRALLDAARWPSLYIGVNLSPMQVRDGSIVDIVRDTLSQTRMEPSRLMLEITEGVLIENPDEMVRRIHDLRELGVKIALDDFGSGYSNLSYLQRFPIDKLKIDRAFVSALGQTANAGVIVQAIIGLGRALGLTVVVEGVETDEQRILLRMAGCDEMQGFLFARPAPAKAIDRMMAQLQTGRLAPQQPPQSAAQTTTQATAHVLTATA